jgi:type II secretory pathway component GspD/PulD (secretin)
MAQMQMPQLPAPAVRVYPNPRDRSLILRAETSQYPHIIDLLATIDQPKPIDSKTRTYQLKRVNAVEMEQMLRETLRLDEAGSRPRSSAGARNPSAPGGGQQSATGPGAQLPETILQESATKSLLGVDPQDITLFSSETANTIMAVAPPAALDYIGKLIEQFESGDIPERSPFMNYSTP